MTDDSGPRDEEAVDEEEEDQTQYGGADDEMDAVEQTERAEENIQAEREEQDDAESG